MSHELPDESSQGLSRVFENPEHLAARDRVVAALNEAGHEDPGARELLVQYAELCHRDADRWAAEVPGDPEVSNMANIRADINLARLWMGVKDGLPVARQYFEEILMAAGQNESTYSLAQEVSGYLDQIDEDLSR